MNISGINYIEMYQINANIYHIVPANHLAYLIIHDWLIQTNILAAKQPKYQQKYEDE